SSQLPTLIDAYLLWKHGSCESDAENRTEYKFDVCCIGTIGMSCKPSRHEILHLVQPNEPQLIPRHLHSMDGDFLAKCINGSGSTDPHIFHSDYFIPEAAVEHFKDDVRNHSGQCSPHQNTSCTENWTAARSVEEAKISVFQQTGIFIMACRHGLVECIYGLAAVNRLLDSCGSLQGLGHDIGCTSRKTIAGSSIGAKAEELNLIVALANHPLYLDGFGIEDLETCEHIFSSSNSAAILIRHASYFHWAQYIDLHFDQWDQDKYMELSQFCFKCNGTRTSFSDEDFVRWKAEESEFLANLALEPPSDAFAVAYVEELEKLRSVEAKYGSVTSVPFLTYTPANFTQSSGLN
ncbi:hypothetical protein P692DRAFT_20669010, partial [Suillus brevipes Sb2]